MLGFHWCVVICHGFSSPGITTRSFAANRYCTVHGARGRLAPSFGVVYPPVYMGIVFSQRSCAASLTRECAHRGLGHTGLGQRGLGHRGLGHTGLGQRSRTHSSWTEAETIQTVRGIPFVSHRG